MPIFHFSRNNKLGLKQSNTTKQNIDGNADAKAQTKDQIEILLKEYELCTIDANHLEDSIWTVTSILITATGAGIGLLSSSIPTNVYNLVVNIGISVFSLLIVQVWYKIVFRWHAIQEEIYKRSEEVEKELTYIHKNLRIRDKLDDMKKGRKKSYTVSNSLIWLRSILAGIWLFLPIFQVIWYIFSHNKF
jgi:hypothetical protein